VFILSRTLLCLDLGSQNIHAVVGKCYKGSIEIKKAAETVIPQNTYLDGRIEDFEELRYSINQLLNVNKIRIKNTVLVIQSTSIITRDIILPATDRQNLTNMVKYEIEQFLPIITTEYVIEYAIVDELQEEGLKKYKIHVAAMPKSMADSLLNLVRECGLKPFALDTHFNAVSKLFSREISINGERLEQGKTAAFIDFGHNSIAIHILTKGKLAFSRIINLGANLIDKEIASSFHITLEEAETRKFQNSNLDPNDMVEGSFDSFNSVIRSQVDIWLSEIQKVFQYYISRDRGNQIDGIYILGGSSRLKGLQKYMEQSLNTKTNAIDQLDIIRESKKAKDFSLREYINAIGGLIRNE
jgi:type IV pilus assembly protein PilM